MDRYAEIEEKYNVKLIYRFMEHNDSNILLKAAAAGDDSAPDLVDTYGKLGFTWYKADLLQAFDGLENIDIKDAEKWGIESFLKYGNFGGLQYGIYPHYWSNKPEMAGCVFVNFDNLKSFGFDINPHEMQEKKEWTWDNFANILNDVKDPEGEKVTPLAIADGYEVFLKSVIFSNGGEILKLGGDGKYVSALQDKQALEAMEYAALLYKDKLASSIDMAGFCDGKAMFASAEVWYGMSVNPNYPAQKLNDFTQLNFPSGPSAGANEISQYVHAGRRLFWLSNITDNNSEDAAYLINAIYEPLSVKGEFSWKNVLKQSYFHHVEGFNDYVRSVDNVKYDYSIQLSDVGNSLTKAMEKIVRGTSTPSEAITSIEGAIQAEIDKTMNNE